MHHLHLYRNPSKEISSQESSSFEDPNHTQITTLYALMVFSRLLVLSGPPSSIASFVSSPISPEYIQRTKRVTVNSTDNHLIEKQECVQVLGESQLTPARYAHVAADINSQQAKPKVKQ